MTLLCLLKTQDIAFYILQFLHGREISSLCASNSSFRKMVLGLTCFETFWAAHRTCQCYQHLNKVAIMARSRIKLIPTTRKSPSRFFQTLLLPKNDALLFSHHSGQTFVQRLLMHISGPTLNCLFEPYAMFNDFRWCIGTERRAHENIAVIYDASSWIPIWRISSSDFEPEIESPIHVLSRNSTRAKLYILGARSDILVVQRLGFIRLLKIDGTEASIAHEGARICLILADYDRIVTINDHVGQVGIWHLLPQQGAVAEVQWQMHSIRTNMLETRDQVLRPRLSSRFSPCSIVTTSLDSDRHGATSLIPSLQHEIDRSCRSIWAWQHVWRNASGDTRDKVAIERSDGSQCVTVRPPWELPQCHVFGADGRPLSKFRPPGEDELFEVRGLLDQFWAVWCGSKLSVWTDLGAEMAVYHDMQQPLWWFDDGFGDLVLIHATRVVYLTFCAKRHPLKRAQGRLSDPGDTVRTNNETQGSLL